MNVYWQQNALADTKPCVNWAKNTLAPAMKEEQDYIFFVIILPYFFRRKFEHMRELCGIASKMQLVFGNHLVLECQVY